MLLKGVNKRVIVIKNPESEIFEEAYFIIRSGSIKGAFRQSKENEMVLEANRIISDYHSQHKSITEKNGAAGSIGGDMTELDSFLNKKNDAATQISNINSGGNNNVKSGKSNKSDKMDKTDKINKAGGENSNGKNIKNTGNIKFDDSQKTEINNPTVNLSDEEIFEDEKFFGSMREDADKYGNFYRKDATPYKSAFSFVSSKKRRGRLSGRVSLPPKSFFAGIGFMSAVIILIRLIEFIVMR